MAREDAHRDFEGLLSRYLSGDLSPEEQAWFQEELRRDPGKRELLENYRLIWESAVPEQKYDLDAEWDHAVASVFLVGPATPGEVQDIKYR